MTFNPDILTRDANRSAGLYHALFGIANICERHYFEVCLHFCKHTYGEQLLYENLRYSSLYSFIFFINSIKLKDYSYFLKLISLINCLTKQIQIFESLKRWNFSMSIIAESLDIEFSVFDLQISTKRDYIITCITYCITRCCFTD